MTRSWVMLGAIVAAVGSHVFATTPYRAVDVKYGGTITGVVRISGPAPKPVLFATGKDPDWCGTSKVSPRLALGARGGVANTVVSLEGITRGKPFAQNRKYVLDQRSCEYVPHILLLPLGAELDIVNSDAVLHNVHSYAPGSDPRTIFNIAQPIKGVRFSVKAGSFSESGAYHATCDAGHPWMSAYVVVAEHPYYAVTDAHGRFELTDVPPGKYTVKMWHEGVAVTKTETQKGKVTTYYYEAPYEERQEVVVTAGSVATVAFTLSLRPGVHAEK